MSSRPAGMFWTTAARIPGIHPMFGQPTWQRWRWMARAWDGQPCRLSDEGRAFVQERLGGALPTQRPREIFIVGGRQGGKSRFVGGVAVPAMVLNPGVSPPCTVVLAARTLQQNQQLFGYVTEALKSIPGIVAKAGANAIECTNGVRVERVTSDFRAVRSRVLAGAVLDELGHWKLPDESSVPDQEFIRAIRPALNTRDEGDEPGILIGLSSPWQKSGSLWDAYEQSYGSPSHQLVMQAATWDMRPTISRATLAEEESADPVNYAVEYGADFRAAQYGFLSEAEYDACVMPDVFEIAPSPDKQYHMRVDHSSGHGRDPAAAAVGHWEGSKIIIDALRVIDPPFKRTSMIDLFAELAKRYHITEVIGDRWDGVAHTNAWRDRGYRYEPAPLNKTKSYLAAMPRIVEGSARLPANERLRTEMLALTRTTKPYGEVIDHPPNRHDDVCNAAALVLSMDRPPENYAVHDAIGF